MVRSTKRLDVTLRNFIDSYYLYELDSSSMMYMVDEDIIDGLNDIEQGKKRDVLTPSGEKKIKEYINTIRFYSDKISRRSLESRYKRDTIRPTRYSKKKVSIDEFQDVYKDIFNNINEYRQIATKNAEKLSLIFPELLSLKENNIITENDFNMYVLAKTKRDLKDVLNRINNSAKYVDQSNEKVFSDMIKIKDIIDQNDYYFDIMNSAKYYNLDNKTFDALDRCNRDYKMLINKKNKMLGI